MAASIRDTDKGMKDIEREVREMTRYSVKVGVIEGTARKDGASMAQIAAWNEYGVPSRKIPSRPAFRQWLATGQGKLNETILRLYKQVTSGNMDAQKALGRLGQFAQDGIKTQIRTGDFAPNADSTIRQKKSSRPLISTGQYRNSIRYQVVGAGSVGGGQ